MFNTHILWAFRKKRLKYFCTFALPTPINQLLKCTQPFWKIASNN